MHRLGFALTVFLFLAASLCAQELLFQDDFKGKLGDGWSWLREDPQAWRAGDRGLEVRVDPGNMWGPANNAKNLLHRPAPDPAKNEIEITVLVENRPTHQWEQVDLAWYYDDSHMVKLGQELVDGKLSIVMGREEKDQCRTIAIVPLVTASVRVRLRVKDQQIRGQFQPAGSTDWRDVGQCSLPVSPQGQPKLSLQFYQGPPDVEHWARVTEFRVLKHR